VEARQQEAQLCWNGAAAGGGESTEE